MIENIYEITIDSDYANDSFYIIRNTLECAIVDIRDYIVCNKYKKLIFYDNYDKWIDTVPLLQEYNLNKQYYYYFAQVPHLDVSSIGLLWLRISICSVNLHIREI